MDKHPEITVVITAYNLEKYIGRCMEELIAQTIQDFDVLIYDDASTDRTPEIIRDYIARFPGRIHCIFGEKNCGSPSRARNIALDSGLIHGRFTIFLDGDDRIEPDFLKALHDKAVSESADISICAYDRVSVENGRVLCSEMHGFPPTVELPEGSAVIPRINTSLWNKLIKTELISQLRLPDFSVGEDLCFLHRLYRHCSRLAFADPELIHYQVRSESVISNTSEETIHRFAKEFSEILSSCGREFFDAEALSCFIHIGISMAIRADQNPNIDIRNHLRWTRQFLAENSILSGTRALRLSSLVSMGVRGFAIWVCRLMYLCRCFRLFLMLYSILTRISGKDIKF